MKNDYSVGDLIYDGKIYDGMNRDLGDQEFYMRWLPKNKHARILELCCGTGRLTIPIAHEEYDITGVDITPSMLEQARKSATEEGVEIKFIEGDVRSLDLPFKYDLIFIPFNSIHHMYTNDDLFKLFDVVQNHLEEDGIFIIDCFNPDIQLIVDGKNELKKVSEYTTEDGRAILVKQSMHYESHTQVNRIEWHYFINGVFDSIQKLDMRMYFPQEMDYYLKSNGFSIIHKFGDFEEGEFSNESLKQIFICKKSGS